MCHSNIRSGFCPPDNRISHLASRARPTDNFHDDGPKVAGKNVGHGQYSRSPFNSERVNIADATE